MLFSDDVLFLILAFIANPQAIGRAERVCKQWKSLVNSKTKKTNLWIFVLDLCKQVDESTTTSNAKSLAKKFFNSFHSVNVEKAFEWFKKKFATEIPVIRIALIGDENAGKSATLFRFIQDQFVQDFDFSIGLISFIWC